MKKGDEFVDVPYTFNVNLSDAHKNDKDIQRNQRGIMYHDKALYGIHTIQNKLVKSRVSATHAAFVELCRVRSLQKGTFKFTINAMKIMGISDILGRWIIAKSENRK